MAPFLSGELAHSALLLIFIGMCMFSKQAVLGQGGKLTGIMSSLALMALLGFADMTAHVYHLLTSFPFCHEAIHDHFKRPVSLSTSHTHVDMLWQ